MDEHAVAALHQSFLEMLEQKMHWHTRALTAAKKVADLEAEVAALKAAAEATAPAEVAE